MFEHLRRWLHRIPIDDPVDRSNAFFMQFYFAFMGCSIPLNKAYVVLHTNQHVLYQVLGDVLPWPKVALGIDLGTDLAITAAAWLGVYLTRRGHFQRAVALFLVVVLGSAILAYGALGYSEGSNDQILVTTLVIAGLMLGRRALWNVYGAIILSFVVGMTGEMLAHRHVAHVMKGAYDALPQAALSYLMVTIILDRSIQALRNALTQSYGHRLQLQQEIVEREHTQEQLLHAQKMDAVGKLSSGVAHDFNNVLGIILGLTLARRRLDEPGVKSVDDAYALARVLEHIELAARRGAAVCRKLLNFSRRDITHAETFDSVEALHELQPLLRQLLPPHVQLSIDTAPHPLPIHFDRSQFELALLNLTSNARDAMPEGGTCTISLAPAETATVVLCIQDTGEGMSDAVRSRIFEPFFTTKAVGSGTGLGLSVVYGLVHRAGGDIRVESVLGQGTRFRISLPLAMASTTNAALPWSETRPRVLLIDDDDDLRSLLASTLQNGGCEVSEAANGAEAERLVEAMPRPPHVLVCDHNMPDTDGATLLRKLRKKLPQVPAILISAYLDSDGSPAHPEDPFNERLPKPFSPDTLLARVRVITSRHQPATEPQVSVD